MGLHFDTLLTNHTPVCRTHTYITQPLYHTYLWKHHQIHCWKNLESLEVRLHKGNDHSTVDIIHHKPHLSSMVPSVTTNQQYDYDSLHWQPLAYNKTTLSIYFIHKFDKPNWQLYTYQTYPTTTNFISSNFIFSSPNFPAHF